METLILLLSFLRADGALPAHLNNPSVLSHLHTVAEAIDEAATRAVPRARLIALAYEESRFGYREAMRGRFPIGTSGECGIFQQIPRFSPIEATCEQLGTDQKLAAKVAVASLMRVIRRHRVRGGRAMDRRICHYNGGNRCNRSARRYARRHAKTRRRVVAALR